MADVLIRMLKLMAGPEGSRHPKKFYSVPDAEAKDLVAAGAAEIVPVPDKQPPAETATSKKREGAETADARPRVAAKAPAPVVVTETDDEKRARYTRDAIEAGIAEDLIAGEVDDRVMFDMLVADGAERAIAATEVWGESPPSHPWIPQPVKPADGDRSGRGGSTRRRS